MDILEYTESLRKLINVKEFFREILIGACVQNRKEFKIKTGLIYLIYSSCLLFITIFVL